MIMGVMSVSDWLHLEIRHCQRRDGEEEDSKSSNPSCSMTEEGGQGND
jgi:hypothetical protein